MVAEVERKRSIGTYSTELKLSSKVSQESIPQINSLVAAWDLGRGESEVLSLAMQKRIGAKVVLDDLQARKCAKLLDIGLIGSVGLLLIAKRIGLVNAVQPEIKKLTEVGLHIDPDLLKKVYQKIGE